MIFRSQINLLRYLQVQPERRARWTALFRFYQEGLLAQGIPAATYPHENYMGFLRNYGLIQWVLHPGGADADVVLTDFGHEFLQYLSGNNYNLQERPF